MTHTPEPRADDLLAALLCDPFIGTAEALELWEALRVAEVAVKQRRVLTDEPLPHRHKLLVEFTPDVVES